MTTLTEGLVVSDVVKKELPDYLSRANEVVAASQTLVLGEVVQKDSSDQLLALAAEADEVQTIGITGTLIGGTFTLTFKSKMGPYVTTDPIAYNANTAAIQTGVDTALGGSMVVVGGTAITAMTFTFSGTGYTGLSQEPIVVDSSALTTATVVSAVDAVQTINITGTLTGGTFTLTFIDLNGARKTTDPIAYNANTAAIQTGVDSALGAGPLVTVSGTAITAMVFTFDGTGYTNLPQSLIEVDSSALTQTGAVADVDAVQTVTITGTLTGGTFTLTFVDLNGKLITTDPIAHDASEANIQTGVDTALGASKVVVSGTVASFTLTFDGTGYTNLPQTLVTLDTSALTQLDSASDVDEVQTSLITGAIDGGDFTITFIDLNGKSVTTDPIAWNANTAGIQTGVDTALGASKVTVGGTGTVASHTLTFDGTGYTNLPQSLAKYDTSNVTTISDTSVERTTAGSAARSASGPEDVTVDPTTAGSAVRAESAPEDVTVTPTTAGAAARTATSVEDVTVTESTSGGAGGNDAYGVILEAVTTGGGETQAVACITNNAELNADNLSYGSGTEALANAALNLKNIKTTAQVA